MTGTGNRAYEGGRALVVVLALAGVLLVAGGAGVVGACTLTSLDCHLRPYKPLKKTSGAIAFPEGFSDEEIASGFDAPTAFDFLPDGRVLVAEKGGLVKVVDDGHVSPTPVLDLRRRVNTAFFRGLVAVAVDPEFEANGFIYVVYTARKRGTTSDSTEPTYVVVSRFVLSGPMARDERVILGAGGSARGDCARLAATADCIPSDKDHIGADIAFARDGTIFVSTGDGGGHERVEETAFTSQDADALGGKLLRVTRDGRGLSSNPFYDGDLASNRSKVWALGLRNPFRLTLAPASGLPVVGDVGWTHADEIDAVPRGGNLGWPCYEGLEETREYRSTRRCRAIYASSDEAFVEPVIVADQAGGKSITGGAFVTSSAYPPQYRSYFYADWLRSWIRHASLDPASGRLIGEPTDFATNAGGPVALRTGPDGLLYLLSLNYGALYRITYSGD